MKKRVDILSWKYDFSCYKDDPFNDWIEDKGYKKRVINIEHHLKLKAFNNNKKSELSFCQTDTTL